MRKEYIVCPQCHGEGSYVNPNIDGNGLSAEDFDEMGEDFREDYLSGKYDVKCSLCDGKRVVEDSEEAREHRAFEAEWRAEQRMESMMLGEY